MVIETSRAISAVARELGISEASLGNWVRAYRENHAADEPPLQLPERARQRELERENREQRMKKPRSFQKLRRTSRRSIGERGIRVHRCGARRQQFCSGYHQDVCLDRRIAVWVLRMAVAAGKRRGGAAARNSSPWSECSLACRGRAYPRASRAWTLSDPALVPRWTR